LENADATELADILTTALTNQTQAAAATANPELQTMLQFVVTTKEGKELAASALEEGLLITPDTRTNTLIVKARKDFMDLLARLIEALDSTDPRKAEIVVFPLANADARSMADILTQLFQLEGTAPANRAVRYTLTGGETVEAPGQGATLGSDEQYALRITVDPRTNSLLVGGTEQYVKLVGGVIRELDSSPAQQRVSKVYRLRNANPADIETALREFLDQERQRVVDVLGEDRMGAAMRLLEREVAVVAEETSGTLLLSASPRYFDIVADMIAKLDEAPPQVLIQVLLAEISLDNTLDIGADWNTSWDEGNTTVGAGTNFGVESNLNALSGLTLSVTASDLSFFFRALQSRGKLEVLSRPQIVATDNQEAEINVGQSVPFISQSTISDSGRVNNTIEYQDVGILLSVTPRINEDGFVRMEVAPEVSSLSESTVQVSENVNAVIVNRRSARTTVTVQDGHTIVIGGLITTTEEDREDKVPLIGDIPLVGNLFKSVRKISDRSELLIVLTPHVLRTVDDADSITHPQVERIRTMKDRDTEKLREAIINSLSRDPEMIKIIQEELEQRGKMSPVAPEGDEPPAQEAGADEKEEEAAVRIEDIQP
jgi:type II secretion system protein D